MPIDRIPSAGIESGGVAPSNLSTGGPSWTTSGAVILQGGDTGANGIGITFPATQSASSNANTLDDYEEGTWTANLTDGTNNVSFTGQYTKVGRMVTISFNAYQLNISALTVTGTQLKITGIPFSALTEVAYSNGGLWANNSGLNYFITLLGTTISFWTANNITDLTSQTKASIGNPTLMSVFGCYTYMAG
jgi:hypothetical protein